VLLLSVALCASASAQSAADFDARYAAEPLVVEDDTVKITFQDDGTATREESLRVRIQSQAGVTRFGVPIFSYQSANESVDVDMMRVRKPDGSVVVTPPENVQDMPAAITREAPFYSDLHEKHVSVKGLGVGDVLEYHVMSRITKPLIPGRFWLSAKQTLDGVILNFSLTVSTPRARPVKWATKDGRPEVSEDRSRRILTWRLSQLEPSVPAPKEGEPTPAADSKASKPGLDIQLSSFPSWDAVGAWYRSLARDRAKPSPEIVAKARELTKEASTEAEKVRALYAFVSTKIHYIGVAFGIGRYQPHAAAEVLANQYGDCKDKDVLLEALLGAIGVKAYPALVSSRGKIDESVPSPGQFDHVITAVPHDGGYSWLDTTAEVAPYGYLIAGLRDKQALVIPSEGTPTLVTTEAAATAGAAETFRMNATLSDQGTLEGTTDWSLQNNDAALLLRALFRQASMAQWKDVVQAVTKRSGFGGEVSDVQVMGTQDVEEPISWRYKYVRKDYSDSGNDRITPPLPYFGLPKPETKADATVNLGAPNDYHYQAAVKLPAGSAPKLPRPRELHETFADYTASYEFKDGVLKADRRFVSKKSEVPSADAEAYRKFFDAVTEDQETYIPLKGSRRLTASNYHDAIWDLPYSKMEEAAKAYDDAREEYQKHDARAEVAALERAVRLDPKFTRAWLWLGDVYRDQGSEKASLAAYRSAIQNDPTELLSYKILAFNQFFHGHFDESLAAWKELVALAPEDADSQEGLGILLVTLQREREAVAPLEAALRIDPSRKDLQTALGIAYIKAGQTDRGRDAMKTGLADGASAYALNAAGYALADAGKELPLALEYATRAVRLQEEACAKVNLSEVKFGDVTGVMSLGSYWDTLGWAHAKLGHLDRAQRYLEAAWTLTQSGTMADHLAWVYERQKKPADAKRLRTLGAAAKGITDVYGRPVSKGKTGASGAGAWSAAEREELTRLRTAKTPLITRETSSAEFYLLVGPGGKVLESRFLSGDDALKKASPELKNMSLGMPFPDDATTRLLRRGVLSCSEVSGCSMVLYTPERVRVE
jgi:tetratricopeptide (TPR) repeat protein